MRRQLSVAFLYTIVTTILFGIAYPYAVTVAAQLLFRDKADGQLLRSGNVIVGSRLLGQTFTGPEYFHARPSAAGQGYDASSSGGSNLSPASNKLVARIAATVSTEAAQGPSSIPIDLVTASGSGLDPHITPAAAQYQADRVAVSRHLSRDLVLSLIARHTEARQFGFLGEPRVNVLELNLDLDRTAGLH